MTVKEDFVQLFIVIWGCNFINFKKFKDLWNEDASRTVEGWTAQKKVFSRFIFKSTFAQGRGTVKGFAEAMLPKITVTNSEACQMFDSFQVGSIWYKFLFRFCGFCETVFEAVCIQGFKSRIERVVLFKAIREERPFEALRGSGWQRGQGHIFL